MRREEAVRGWVQVAALVLALAGCGGGGSGGAPASAGRLQLDAASYAVGEASGTLQITVTRSGGSAGAVSVTLATADGTATAPADYAAATETVSFGDGDVAPLSVTLAIAADALHEGDETFTVALSNPTGGASLGAQASATVTVLDDDPAMPAGVLELSAPVYTATEAGGTVRVTVVRSNGTSGTVGVTLSTADGTATAGLDYQATSVPLTIAGGDDFAEVLIPIVDDTLEEGDEAFTVHLSAPTGGASLGAQASATVTTLDDDARTLRFSASRYTVDEGAGNLLVTVLRAGDPSGVVSAVLSTAAGTASAPADYEGQAVTVTFADGDVAPREVAVPIVADALDEPDETFTVSLGSPSGATLGGGPITATVTIRDDDGLPSAPVLLVGGKLKQLAFTWPPVLGATAYRLLEDGDGASGFTQVGADILPTGGATEAVDRDISVHRFDWAHARYRVQACNGAGCTDSAEPTPLALQGAAIAAIGYIKASNPGSSDSFGSAVALSQDGSTLVVGAIDEDSGSAGVDGNQADESAGNSGAAYVFRRSGPGGAWQQEAYLKASNVDAVDYFGIAVAVNADGTTVAVGARHEDGGAGGDPADNSTSSAGAAYVFVLVGGTWTQEAYLKAGSPDANDWYGSALALSGSGDTLAVGASVEDSSATGIGGDETSNGRGNSGAVFVYARSAGTWAKQAYVKAPNTGGGDGFGTSVALSRSGDRLLVGATGEASAVFGVGGDQTDDSALGAGAAYLYERSGTSWAFAQYFKASNTDAGDEFGYSVAISADGSTLAVGAPREDCALGGVDGNQADDTAADAGAVYVFAESGGGWVQQAYVKASVPHAGDLFGAAVALSAQGGVLAVGAPGEDGAYPGVNGDTGVLGLTSAGAVYVLARDAAGTWTQRAYVKGPDPDAGDAFGGSAINAAGRAVALSGNGATLAVGATGEDGGDAGVGGDPTSGAKGGSGAVFLY